MNRLVLIMFVGVPGSGKSTLARKLAKELDATVLNSDSLRLAMWGSFEGVKTSHTDFNQRKHNNKLTFGAMDYAAKQILKSGKSVVYDCNANRRDDRLDKRELAMKNEANLIVIRIRVPYEISLERLQSREVSGEQRRMGSETAKKMLDRFKGEIEEPESDEMVIEVDGTKTFEEQYQVIEKKLIEFLHKS